MKLKYRKTAAFVIAFAIIGALYVLWISSLKNNTGYEFPADVVASGDLFEGKITNKDVTPVKLEGVGVYDRSCIPVGNGLTDCHGGIKTEKYGVIDFNYQHDMARKPCIKPNDKVVVTILDSSGKAQVQKLF